MTAARASLFVACALLAACSSSTKGLKVDVDPAGYGTDAVTMEIVLSVTGGFMLHEAATVDNVRYVAEDRTGDDVPELIVQFNGPFPKPFSFHVDTQNKESLHVEATAKAYNHDMDLYAGAAASGELAPGGSGAVSLTLAPQTSPVGADTRTTDLASTQADVTVTSTDPAPPHLSSAVVCNLNGDQYPDLVIGAPSADPGLGTGASGAIYVVLGGSAPRPTVDLHNPTAADVHIFGELSGSELGAAVACADVNHDGIDDLIAGDPHYGTSGVNQADNQTNAGRIYVVYGRASFGTTAFDLTTTAGADLTWTTSTKDALLGSALAVTVAGGRAALLASAPGAMTVHLLPIPASPSPHQVIDADGADHVTFTGIAATALGAGDLNGDGAAPTNAPADILLGDAQYRAPGDGVDRRGAVYVFSAVDPSGSAARAIGDATVMIPGPGAGSQFGAAVLALDSGRGEDLLIGAPGAGDGTGAVYLFQHADDFFDVATRSTTEQHVGTLAGPDPGGRFGAALAASRAGANGSGATRLVVGAPDLARPDRPHAGAAYLYAGNSDRAFRLREQLYGHAENDFLGTAVAGGQANDGDAIADLVAVAPGLPTAAGAVYIRFGMP
jgi:hypothetical protein